MSKTLLSISCGVVLSASCLCVQASLVNGSALSIESGSYFDLFGQNQITGVDGIVVGATQGQDYSIFSSRIDTFSFLLLAGNHYTTSPANVISASGNVATIDFSGWAWNYTESGVGFSLGSGAWAGNADGVAELTCGNQCGDGDSYILNYTATIPENDPNGYGGYQYGLHLIGNISTVPVPAAVWLFGSGLLGLVGFARRKKA